MTASYQHVISVPPKSHLSRHLGVFVIAPYTKTVPPNKLYLIPITYSILASPYSYHRAFRPSHHHGLIPDIIEMFLHNGRPQGHTLNHDIIVLLCIAIYHFCHLSTSTKREHCLLALVYLLLPQVNREQYTSKNRPGHVSADMTTHPPPH